MENKEFKFDTDGFKYYHDTYVKAKIEGAINALDATASQSAGTDGLALSITEADGKITSISGSIAANTYDAYGSASAAQTAAATDATNKVNAVKTEIIGGATSSGNTLKKLEDRVSPLETAVGSGGSIDTRISNAVATEATRAQAAESALQNNIEALTQSNIVVVADHTAVSSPDSLTIYREQGTNTYSDWMYQNGSWKKMAEYDNAIDDEPTDGSDNLVKSGGVFNATNIVDNIQWDTQFEGYIVPVSGAVKTSSDTHSNNQMMQIPLNGDCTHIHAVLGVQGDQGSIELGLSAMAFYNNDTLLSVIPFQTFGQINKVDVEIPNLSTSVYIFNRKTIQPSPSVVLYTPVVDIAKNETKFDIVQDCKLFEIAKKEIAGIESNWTKVYYKLSDYGISAGDTIYIGAVGKDIQTIKSSGTYFYIIASDVPNPTGSDLIINVVPQLPFSESWKNCFVKYTVPSGVDYINLGAQIDKGCKILTSIASKEVSFNSPKTDVYRKDRISKLAYIVNMEAKYILNTYIPNKFPDLNNITFDFWDPYPEIVARTPCNALCAVAKLIASGLYDSSITGNTIDVAISKIRPIANALVDNYDGWKHCWETAMWMHQLAIAMHLLNKHFTSTEMANLRTIVLAESDYLLNKQIGSVFVDNERYEIYDALWGESLSDNTQLESVNFWNKIFAIAVICYKDAPNWQAYKDKMVEFSIAASSSPNDENSTEVINGYALSNLLGYNITNEGFAFNGTGGILHPEYMIYISELIQSTGAFYSWENERLPIASQHNIDKLISALLTYNFTEGEVIRGITVIPPYGTILKPTLDSIYYPQGNNWGTERTYGICKCLCALYSIGIDPKTDFSRYADLLIDRGIYLINRFDDGHYVLNGTENTYDGGGYGAEMDAADNYSSALFTLLYTPKFSTADWSD